MGQDEVGKSLPAAARAALPERDAGGLQSARGRDQHHFPVSLGRAKAATGGLHLGPVSSDPKYRYGLTLDLRSENWDVRNGASLLGGLNLRREAIGAEFADFVSGRWQWSASAELLASRFSRRDRRDCPDARPDGQGIPAQADDPSDGETLGAARTASHVCGQMHRRRQAGCGPSRARDLKSCREGCAWIGCLDRKATTMKCSSRCVQGRRSATRLSMNCSCWVWSGTTTCGCGPMSAPTMGARAALRSERATFFPIGRWTRTCTAMDY